MAHRRRPPSTDPQLAIAYVRTSTDDQALGPHAQLASIDRWAAANGMRIAAVHRDLGMSGAAEVADRPELLAALASMEQHGAGILVVAKRDRLARDIVIAATIERLVQGKGARIVSADGLNVSGPEGALLLAIIDAFSAYERALIRTRTTAALAVKKARGERVGEVPFGYRVEGDKLTPCASEQRALDRIAELRAEGLSIRQIAVQLMAEAVPARGARWHPTSVARLLTRTVAA